VVRWWCFVDVDDDARTIGQRLWRIRSARRKSLRVVAGLAGISKSTLSQVERGERALDSLSEIVALANALQIAPSELTKLPVPAPANGDTDAGVQAVRLALRAVVHDVPGGLALPAEVLRARVTAAVEALCRCEDEREVGVALPGLIRDLHTSIAAGRDVAELLPLSAWLHTQVTVPWLRLAGSSPDLCSQAIQLAYQAAREHDTTPPLALAAVAGARVLLADGAFDLARARLDAVTVPTNTSESMQLAGFLALRDLPPHLGQRFGVARPQLRGVESAQPGRHRRIGHAAPVPDGVDQVVLADDAIAIPQPETALRRAAVRVGARPADLRPLLRMANQLLYSRWLRFDEAVRTDERVLGELDFNEHEQEIFSKGVEAATSGDAHALATGYDFTAHRRLLDLGGGKPQQLAVDVLIVLPQQRSGAGDAGALGGRACWSRSAAHR